DDHGMRVKLTAFRRDTRSLIGFVSCFTETEGLCADRPFGTYANIGRARARGLELEGHALIADSLELGAAYTFLKTEDRTRGSPRPGNDPSRRPEHALTVMADWQMAPGVSVGADLRAVSDSFDDAANAVRVDGYAVMTLRGEWAASERVSLFGRIENAWDETYQTAAGYATGGRGASIGARLRW